jgi:hypothetical protein
LAFHYAPFDEEPDATTATGDSDIPSRLQDIPFTATLDDGDADADDSSRFHAQCTTVLEMDNPISLYSYEATGPDNIMYTVSMTGSGDDAMTIQGGGEHGFYVGPDADGILQLLDHSAADEFRADDGPSIMSGDYQWTLHAMDETAGVVQTDMRSWMVRITQTDYIAPAGSATNSNEPEHAPTADPPTMEWADFISSNFVPEAFGVTRETGNPAVSHATEGPVKTVHLGQTDSGEEYEEGVSGALQADDDIDVIYLGGLTPDVVLDVMVAGTLEGGVTHEFNDVSFALYRHISGEGQGDAIDSVDSETMGFMETPDAGQVGAYKDLECGFYYLAISGKEGGYTLTWSAANLTDA